MSLKFSRISSIFLVIILQLIPISAVYADDIPQGVSIQQVKAVSKVAFGTYVWWNDGKVLDDKEPRKVGDIKVRCDFEYTLTFYNVGALGGEKYSNAIFTKRYIARDNGEIVRSRQEVLAEAYDKYLATKPKKVVPMPQAGEDEVEILPNTGKMPIFAAETFSDNLVFSGGPNGVFEGTFINSDKTLKFKVDGGGSFVSHGPEMSSGEMMIPNPTVVWRGWDPSDSGARFSGLTGQVEIKLPGEDDWRLCKMDTIIPIGASVRTQEDSMAIFSFADMSTFVMKADSEVVVDTPPEKESKLKLVAGNTWANIKKIVVDGSFSMEMNQAVCGIKGTTFVCEVKKDGTSTLKVIEGKVEFTAKADGKKVMVEGGSMVSADQKGLGTLGKFDAAKETDLWEKVKNIDTSSSKVEKTEQNHKKSSANMFIIGAVMVVLIGGVGLVLLKKKWNKVL